MYYDPWHQQHPRFIWLWNHLESTLCCLYDTILNLQRSHALGCVIHYPDSRRDPLPQPADTVLWYLSHGHLFRDSGLLSWTMIHWDRGSLWLRRNPPDAVLVHHGVERGGQCRLRNRNLRRLLCQHRFMKCLAWEAYSLSPINHGAEKSRCKNAPLPLARRGWKLVRQGSANPQSSSKLSVKMPDQRNERVRYSYAAEIRPERITIYRISDFMSTNAIGKSGLLRSTGPD